MYERHPWLHMLRAAKAQSHSTAKHARSRGGSALNPARTLHHEPWSAMLTARLFAGSNLKPQTFHWCRSVYSTDTPSSQRWPQYRLFRFNLNEAAKATESQDRADSSNDYSIDLIGLKKVRNSPAQTERVSNQASRQTGGQAPEPTPEPPQDKWSKQMKRDRKDAKRSAKAARRAERRLYNSLDPGTEPLSHPEPVASEVVGESSGEDSSSSLHASALSEHSQPSAFSEGSTFVDSKVVSEEPETSSSTTETSQPRTPIEVPTMTIGDYDCGAPHHTPPTMEPIVPIAPFYPSSIPVTPVTRISDVDTSLKTSEAANAADPEVWPVTSNSINPSPSESDASQPSPIGWNASKSPMDTADAAPSSHMSQSFKPTDLSDLSPEAISTASTAQHPGSPFQVDSVPAESDRALDDLVRVLNASHIAPSQSEKSESQWSRDTAVDGLNLTGKYKQNDFERLLSFGDIEPKGQAQPKAKAPRPSRPDDNEVETLLPEDVRAQYTKSPAAAAPTREDMASLEEALRESKAEDAKHERELFRIHNALDYSKAMSSSNPRSISAGNFFTSSSVQEATHKSSAYEYVILTPNQKRIRTRTAPFVSSKPPQDMFSVLSGISDPTRYMKSIAKLEKAGWTCVGGGGPGQLLVFKRPYSRIRRVTIFLAKTVASVVGVASLVTLVAVMVESPFVAA